MPLSASALNDLGKGVPLHLINQGTRLFIVEFKAGRTDLFYLSDPTVPISPGDLVIVEADRGQDLGRIKEDKITIEDVKAFNAARKQELADISGNAVSNPPIKVKGALAGLMNGDTNVGAGYGDSGANANAATVKGLQKEIMPKRIFGKAGPADQQLLAVKLQDEAAALAICQAKVKQRRYPMEVLDAEYQWDRRKLTFYFVAEKRIDFRELVRELFRMHKTRIWMACLGDGYLNDEETEA